MIKFLIRHVDGTYQVIGPPRRLDDNGDAELADD
jgi:hypothetical protein